MAQVWKWTAAADPLQNKQQSLDPGWFLLNFLCAAPVCSTLISI